MSRPLAILTTIVGTLGTLLFFYLITQHQQDKASAYAWLGLIAVLLAIEGRKILSGETPWYSPHAMALFTGFVYYIVGSTAGVYFDVESLSTRKPIPAEQYTRPMAAITLAVFGYIVGYRLTPKPRFLSARFEWFFTDTETVQKNFNLIAIIIFLVGFIAWQYMFFVMGGLRGHLQQINQRSISVGLAGGTVWHLTKWAPAGALLYFARNGVTVISLGMIGALSFLLFIYGSRSLLGVFIIGVTIVYQIRFRKIPPWAWVGISAGMVAAFTTMIFLRKAGGSFTRAQHIYQKTSTTLEGRVHSYVGDYAFINCICDVINNWGERIPYLFGETFLSVLHVVPGKLWPQKYEILRAGPVVYMDELTPHLENTSVGPTILGEFFMNFGWPGMFFCSLFGGALVAVVTGILTRHPLRRQQVFYTVCLATLSPEVIALIKHGASEFSVFPYLLLPLAIPYLPNFGYLTSPPHPGGAYQR